MAAMLGAIIILILIAGAASSYIVIPAAVTVRLTCTDDDHLFPVWILQGNLISEISTGRQEQLGVTLFHAHVAGSRISSPISIDGSPAIHNMTLQCKIRGESVYNTTILYQDHLPAPSHLTITNDGGSTIIIEWEPPILDPPILQGPELDHVQIHMNPNILVYSLSITDTTNRTTLAVNGTQTSYRFTSYIQCHRYQFQVSAWNTAGEGDGNTIQYLHKKVPANPTSDPVTVMMIPTQAIPTRKRQQQTHFTISFTVQVDISCRASLPDKFIVNVTGPGLAQSIQIMILYDNSEEMNVSIPVPGVEDCTGLRVRIRATNSAGTSEFSEIPLPECESTDDGAATIPTARPTGSNITPIDPVAQDQEGITIIYIAVGSAVGAVVIMTAGTLLLIVILWRCKRPSKVKPPEENEYTDSPSLGGTPVYQLQTPAVDIPTKSPTVSMASSADSTDSNTPLLQPPKPTTEPQAPERNPQVVYAIIDPTKHSRPQPPTNDNQQVKYAQIKH